MSVVVAHVGRAVVVKPAVYGQLFEQHCTVVRQERTTSWEYDADTGERHQVVTYDKNPRQMWWYAEDKGEKVFAAYAGYWQHIVKTLKTRGLDVVEEYRVNTGLGKPDYSKIKGTQWRGRQKEAMALMITQPGGVIVCPTAYGKTFMIKKLAQLYPHAEICVTVNSIDIANDIYNGLRDELWSQLGMIGDSKMRINRVNVVVAQSLHKCPKDISILLADECHTLLTDNYIKKFNRFYRAKLIGLTASPEGRSDQADAMAEAVFGPKLIDIGYDEAIATGNVVPIRVRMYNVHDGPEVSHITNKAYADKKALWRNNDRNGGIARVVRELEEEYGPDAQILIMVDKTEHAYALGQLLPEYTIVTGPVERRRFAKLKNDGAFVEGQRLCSPKRRAWCKREFEAYRLKRVISTKIWSKGVDFRDLSVLVRADGSASKIDATQIPGRLARLGNHTNKKYGLLVDFFDRFSGNLIGRSKKRVDTYKGHGWPIENRELPGEA